MKKRRREMKRCIVFGVVISVLILLPFICQAQETKLPVFFLRYDAGAGREEIEEEGEEEEVEPSSQRHTVTLRIKEELSTILTTNLYTAVSRKKYYLEKGSYSYFYLNPDVSWEITDTIKWYNGFRCKWTFYDELDSAGLSKDFTSLFYKTNVTIKPLDKLKVIPSFKGVFDLYENDEESKQTHTFGMGIQYTIGNVSVGGRYRGSFQFPLGEQSTEAYRSNNEVGVNVKWDPNK